MYFLMSLVLASCVTASAHGGQRCCDTKCYKALDYGDRHGYDAHKACSSYLKTTITPCATTTTKTVAGYVPRKTVTVACNTPRRSERNQRDVEFVKQPNSQCSPKISYSSKVPDYACGSCSSQDYALACSCLGVKPSTITVAKPTITKTVTTTPAASIVTVCLTTSATTARTTLSTTSSTTSSTSTCPATTLTTTITPSPIVTTTTSISTITSTSTVVSTATVTDRFGDTIITSGVTTLTIPQPTVGITCTDTTKTTVTVSTVATEYSTQTVTTTPLVARGLEARGTSELAQCTTDTVTVTEKVSTSTTITASLITETTLVTSTYIVQVTPSTVTETQEPTTICTETTTTTSIVTETNTSTFTGTTTTSVACTPTGFVLKQTNAVSNNDFYYGIVRSGTPYLRVQSKTRTATTVTVFKFGGDGTNIVAVSNPATSLVLDSNGFIEGSTSTLTGKLSCYIDSQAYLHCSVDSANAFLQCRNSAANLALGPGPYTNSVYGECTSASILAVQVC